MPDINAENAATMIQRAAEAFLAGVDRADLTWLDGPHDDGGLGLHYVFHYLDHAYCHQPVGRSDTYGEHLIWDRALTGEMQQWIVAYIEARFQEAGWFAKCVDWGEEVPETTTVIFDVSINPFPQYHSFFEVTLWIALFDDPERLAAFLRQRRMGSLRDAAHS
ncbi:MAG: hypothetical protein KGM18_00780 [Sphingomonadales bacterium]|nr:hypothetical protein [Sphingomonadales bacterium]